jgi:Na+/melibiose symporter-like transporter
MAFIDIFKEENGTWSSQRVIYVLGSVYSMVMGAVVYGVSKDYAALLVVVTSISATFGAQKLIQKGIESHGTNQQ